MEDGLAEHETLDVGRGPVAVGNKGDGSVITGRRETRNDSLIRRQSNLSNHLPGMSSRRSRFDRRVSHLPVDGPSMAPDRRSSNLDMLEMARRAAASLPPEHLNTLEEYAEGEIEGEAETDSGDKVGKGPGPKRKSVSRSQANRRDSNQRRSSSQMPRSRGRRDSIGLATTPSAPQNYGQVQQRVEQESEVQPQGEYLGGGYKERLQKLARKSREVVRALNMNPYQRNAIDVAHMVGHVKKVKFFQSMPIHVTEQICRVAQYKKLLTDYCICKQNDEGDSFFVLLSGSVSVHVLTGNEGAMTKDSTNGAGASGSKADANASRENVYGVKVAVMTSGMCFGEVALICGQKRSASILAQEEGELLIITKEDYVRTLQRVMSTVFLPDSVKNCMHTKPALRRESEWVLIADIVQHHAFFDKIPRRVLLEVCKTMQFLVLESKNRVYKQGDQARFLYIVLTGTVELYSKSDSTYLRNQSHQTAEALSTNQNVYGGSSVPIGDIDIGETYGNHIMTLSSGDCFGDTEMYFGCSRSKTALTMDKTEMIVIDKMALAKMMEVDRAICLYPDRIRRLLGVQPNKRKAEDLKSLAYYTESLSFMSALTEANNEVVMAILRIAGCTSFSQGEVIVRQGDRGSHFYIAFSGTVTVHQRDTEGVASPGNSGRGNVAAGASSAGSVNAASSSGPPGSSSSGAPDADDAGPNANKSTPDKTSDGSSSTSSVAHAPSFPGDANLKETILKYGPLIRTINVGEGFGELNLINEDIGDEEINSSTATCVAATDVFAISLSEKDYNRIVRHAHEQETMEKMALLRQTQGLYSVPYNKLLRLCLHMTLETFHRGATLVEEGASCTDIFFIKEGECRVGMTRSEPIEANSIGGGSAAAFGGRRRPASLMPGHKGSVGAGGTGVGATKEIEVALVGPCETVGDYAFFNSLLQPSTVRATRTTMAYKLTIDSLEKNVPANILDGLRDVSTQRMQKQRDRFVQAMAIRNKIKLNSSTVKHTFDLQAAERNRGTHASNQLRGGLEDSEDSLRTFSSLMQPSSQSVGYTIGSRSPDMSSSFISRSSSRLPNLRVASNRRTMSKLNKTIEAALSAFRKNAALNPLSQSVPPPKHSVGGSATTAALPEPRAPSMMRKSHHHQHHHKSLGGLSSSPSSMPSMSSFKARRKFEARSPPERLPSGPPDPLRERSVAINPNATDLLGPDGGGANDLNGHGDSVGSFIRRLEYDSKGRRVHEGLKMFEVDVPNDSDAKGCARLRYVVSDSHVPKASEEYKRQLVYDYTREHLRRMAKRKTQATTI